MSIKAPAKRPCGSCPYRQDVPSGVWAREEYEKLPDFDKPTAEQPPAVFGCHQQDGHLCAGWAATHDMTQSLGLRVAEAMGYMTHDDVIATIEYTTDVPLWASGQEAWEHGVSRIETPDPRAQRAITRLEKKLGDKLIK